MDVSLENVERALTQFYRTNSTQQAEAHQWLTTVQSSSDAWALVWELLQPNRSWEAQFFAATTLHTKVMKNWPEVPVDQYDNLKRKILETIVMYSTGPKIVLNRLCIALAAYLIQTTPHHWTNSLEDVLNIFTPENLPNIPPDQTIWILLEVLVVVPEEWTTMIVNSVQRNAVRSAMEEAAPKVMSLLGSLLKANNTSSEVGKQAVKAITAWLPIKSRPLSDYIDLVSNLIDIIGRQTANNREESCENELEILTQIVTMSQHMYQSRPVFQVIHDLLLLQRLWQYGGNEAFRANVCKALIGAGETHYHLLLTSLSSDDPWQVSVAKELLQSILAITCSPGWYPTTERLSNLTLPFWYLLQDDLMTLEVTEMRAALIAIVPIYQDLTRILVHKSLMPPDDLQLASFEQELFTMYRQDINDTIVCFFPIVREYFISHLLTKMRQAARWQDVEVVLHVAFALAEMTLSCEDLSEKDYDGRTDASFEGGHLSRIVGSMADADRSAIVSILLEVPQFALSNPHVVNALNHAIGAYSEWWIGHPDSLSRLIPTLITSFANTKTSTSATLALKDITLECTTTMAPFAPTLLAACQQALSKGLLQPAECVRLMYSVGRLLSVLPYDEMLTQLGHVITEHTNEIGRALSQPTLETSRVAVVHKLRMLGILCSSLYLNDSVKADPPSLLVIQKLLPVFRAIVSQWPTNSQIAQEICKCLKGTVVNLMDACEPCLASIIDLALACFSTAPNPATLDLARQVLLLFGPPEKSRDLVIHFLGTISHRTMSLACTSAQASEASDVLQGYFQLSATLTKKNLPLLPLVVDPNQLFNLGVASLTLSDNSTVKAAVSMLCTMISQSIDNTALSSVVLAHGEHLVHTSLRCIGGISPRQELDVFAEIFLVLNKKYCSHLARWLPALLARPGFPTENATAPVKQKFSSNVLRERANRRRLQDIIKEFALVARGLVTAA